MIVVQIIDNFWLSYQHFNLSSNCFSHYPTPSPRDLSLTGSYYAMSVRYSLVNVLAIYLSLPTAPALAAFPSYDCDWLQLVFLPLSTTTHCLFLVSAVDVGAAVESLSGILAAFLTFWQHRQWRLAHCPFFILTLSFMILFRISIIIITMLVKLKFP